MDAEEKKLLHVAADKGNLEKVRELLTANHTRVNEPDPDSWNRTPLHKAALRNHVDLARYLVQNGADVEATADDAWTALHYSGKHGHSDIGRLLITRGADVNAQKGDGFVPLHSAAYKGSIDFCRVLMDAGAELHTCNVKKETPQMVAKARGFPQLAELLAPPAVAADGGKDYAGRVQLHLAASRGELDVLTRVLKIHPSCVDAPDLEKFRRTALHKASLKGHTECVRVLVGAGADVNLLADDRWSSLHYASKEGHTEILQILFDAGADINAQKVDGFTPLHNAAFRGFIDSCRLLITLGADRVCRNHAGHTPSDVAKGKADQGGEKQRAVFEYIEALDKVDMPSAVEFTVLKVFTALMTSATPDECIDELKKLLNVVTRHGSGSVEWEKLRVICTRMRIAESALWTSEVARAFGKVARALNPAP